MTTRPYTRPGQEKQPEDKFNMEVTFVDDQPPMNVEDVSESEVAGLYRCLGDAEGILRLQPRPGFHYMTAVRRVKHITATLITETSN